MLKTNEMAHEQGSLSDVLIKSLQKYHNLRRAASQLNVQAILREVISVIKKKVTVVNRLIPEVYSSRF